MKTLINHVFNQAIAELLHFHTWHIHFQVKDTLYKFWVLKVRLRDWGCNGDGEVNNTLALTHHDRSFNTHCSRMGSHCRSNEVSIYRNRGKLSFIQNSEHLALVLPDLKWPIFWILKPILVLFQILIKSTSIPQLYSHLNFEL